VSGSRSELGGKTDVALRGDHALKRAAGYAISAGVQGNNFPEHVQNDDGASHKASLTFVRERLMALVAVLAAGEVAVVVAA